MGLDTTVTGDSGASRAAAAALRSQAEDADAAEQYLRGESRTPVEHWQGKAGDAYREATAALQENARGDAAFRRRLADGLTAYAEARDEVVQVMARVREIARERLVLDGTTVLAPGPYASTEQVETYDRLRGLVARGHHALAEAEVALSEAAALPGLDADPLAPPPAPTGLPPWPPPEEAWPGSAPQTAPSPAPEPVPNPAPGPTPTVPVGPDGVIGAATPTPAPAPAPIGTTGLEPPRVAMVTAPLLIPAVSAPPPAPLHPPITREESLMFHDHTIDVTLPQGWHQRTDPDTGILIAARPQEPPPSGHVPEVVVRTVAVSDDLLEWRDAAQVELADRLPDFALEDADTYPLGEHEVDYRRFSHDVGGTDVVTEQWSWAVDGIGVTLTCTTARADYAIYADLFEQIAGTVEVLPSAA